jgi:hypothetical protein
VIWTVVVAVVVILTLVMVAAVVMVLALVVMVLLVTDRVIGAVARYRHTAATDRHHACNRKCR